MERDVTNSLNNYFFAIRKEQEHLLADIKNWASIKVAFDEDMIWMTGLNWNQIQSSTVKGIPHAYRWYEKEGMLYKLGSVLPDRKSPSFLWTPIKRALKVQLPDYNCNFFGIENGLTISMIETKEPKEISVVCCKLEILQSYLRTAPSVRLKNMQWCIVDNEMALIMGTPLLPLPTEDYWVRKNFIFPVGYDLDISLLQREIDEKINPTAQYWVVWNHDASYFLIEKGNLAPLSLSSFKASLKNLSDEK